MVWGGGGGGSLLSEFCDIVICSNRTKSTDRSIQFKIKSQVPSVNTPHKQRVVSPCSDGPSESKLRGGRGGEETRPGTEKRCSYNLQSDPLAGKIFRTNRADN